MNIGSQIALRSSLSQRCLQPVVSVVDSEFAVRQSVHTLVEAAGWRARTFASAAEFLSQPRPEGPNCLLVDMTLPDLSGLDLQTRMADRPETPIIFISGFGDVAMIVRAMKAGALEFLTKPLRNDAILRAIEDAIALSERVLRREGEVSLLRDRYGSLTPREREVLRLVVQGYLNKQMGFELGISEITVKAHRGKVMRKMSARSLAQLVNMAMTLDLKPSRPPGVSGWLRETQ